MTASNATTAAPTYRTVLCAVVGLALLVGAGSGAWLLYARRGSPPVEAPKEGPPSSPFLNARPGVEYVGSAACVRCHEGHADSFHRTGMGRSMAPVDLRREPPDAAYDHSPSQRRYQVVRKDGKMFHRELL